MITLNDMLNFHLRPWLKSNNLKEKFDTKVQPFTNQYPNLKLNYRIEYPKPYNEKTRFYHTLIINTINAELFQVLVILPPGSIENVILYVLNETLHKKLRTQLINVGRLIKYKNYQLTDINYQKNTTLVSKEQRANAYVVQLLKLAHIQLYLEIQETFNLWVKDKKTIEDLYIDYLNEQIPEKILIVPALSADEPTTQIINQYQPDSNLSFYYKQINTNPEKLVELFNFLKQNNLIHPETSLVNFKRIFSNTQIEKPIIWTGTHSELFYFIKLIHSVHKLVNDLKQKQWQITTICFKDADEEPLDLKKLRSLKKPRATASIIENAIIKLM